MAPVHRVCRRAVSYHVVIADDGAAVIVRWCRACAVALNDTDCDPSTPLRLEDVPADVVARLIGTAYDEPGTVN